MNPVTTYPGLSPAQASLGTSFPMGGSLGAMSRGYGASHVANVAAAAAAQSRPSFAIQELLGLGTPGGGFPGMSSAQHSHHQHQSFAGHNPLFPQDHTSPVGGHNPPSASHYGYQNTFTSPGVHHHHPSGQVSMSNTGMTQGVESPEFGGYGTGNWRSGLLPGLGRDDALGGLGGRGLTIDTSPSPEKAALGFHHSGNICNYYIWLL